MGASLGWSECSFRNYWESHDGRRRFPGGDSEDLQVKG